MFFFSTSKTELDNAKITIRTAKNNDDILAISEISKITYQATFIDPKSKQACFSEQDLEYISKEINDTLLELLNNKEHYIIVACHNNVIVGYAVINFNNSVFLDKLYVLPSEQKLGVGNHLLLSCMDEVLRRNQNEMRLEVWDGNTNAIEYYKTNGFVVTDKRHQKQNSDGKIFHGSEMFCADVKNARNNLHDYLENKNFKHSVSNCNH